MAALRYPCYPRRAEVAEVKDMPAWINELLENPILQMLAFVVMFVVRIEIDRWLRKQDTKAQKKKKAVADG